MMPGGRPLGMMFLVLKHSWQTPSVGYQSRQHGEHTSELRQTVLEAAQRWCFSNVFVETLSLHAVTKSAL